MRVRRLLVVLLLLFMTVVAAAPATAGGPTSALLVVPGTGRTASLYHSDPEYGQLTELLGEGGGTTGVPVDGAFTTVTWLIHDTTVWRVDRIYLGADGGPWIGTQSSPGGDLAAVEPVWHRPAQGKELSLLLQELGVAPENGDPLPPVVAAPAPEPEPVTTEPAAGDDARSPWVGRLGWGAGGALLGAALVLGAARVRGPRPEDPAWADDVEADLGVR